MDNFLKVAETLTIYKVRSSWLDIAKLYNSIAKKQGGTISMGFVLLAIYGENGVPVTQIAPRLRMEPNSLSRILKSMEEKGMIYRERSQADKRKVYIKLTELGQRMRRIAAQSVFRLEKQITKELSSDQLATFFEVLNHIPQAIARFKQKMAGEAEL